MSKILVVDDEMTILDNLKFVLELENHDVFAFLDSVEALHFFTKNCESIDVVITDMRMPNFTGMDILQEVKKIMPEMSVIILTGHGDMENAIQSMKEGAFEYLKKPVSADSLTISVNNAINKKNLLLENAKMHQEILDNNIYLQGLNDSAQKILMNMLPKKFPTIEGFDFSSVYKSADMVGGDMYNISDTGDYVLFYIFDVTSHGILASVITVILKSFILNIEYNLKHNSSKKTFSEMVSALNKEMNRNTAQNIFASLFIGLIDKKSRLLSYISAGHIVQFVLKKDELISLDSTGTLIGIFEDITYPANELQLESGDRLLLFTDGIVEAAIGDELYGYQRLQNILADHTSYSIQELTQRIFEDVSLFCRQEYQDDISLLGIQIH